MEQTIRQLVTWLALILPALMLLGAACVAAMASIALGNLQDWIARRAHYKSLQDGDDVWT